VTSITDTLNVIKNAVTAYEKQTKNKASLALIGGYAAIFFGAERTTLDVDLFFHSTAEYPGSSFFNFLKEYLPDRFKLRFIEATKDPTDPLKHDLVVIDDSKGDYPRIDILLLRYKWELEGINEVKPIDKLPVPLFPLPYLVAMKLLAGGRKDELDILDLLQAATKSEIDKIKKLAKKVRKDKNLQKLLNEIKEQE